MSPSLSLDDPVTDVPGVTARLAGDLAGDPFRIETVRDLVWYLPRQGAYRDLGALVPIADLEIGKPATVVATLVRWDKVFPQKRGRGGKKLTIQKATLRDEQRGTITASFFNQPWLPGKHAEGSRVAISGTVEKWRTELRIKAPKMTSLDDDVVASDLEENQFVPVYKATEKVSSPRIARLVQQALELLPTIPDHLPEDLRGRHELARLDWALRTIHAPPDQADLAIARQRLVYDELLVLQLVLQRRRIELESDAVGLIHHPVAMGAVDAFRASLPFAPTADQEQAFNEIDADLAESAPMHRLLQGDVGTGKTIVAAHAMLRAVDAGRQAVLMAPTTVLAEQHLVTFQALMEKVMIPALGRPPRVHLLTSAMPKSYRARVMSDVVSGDCDLLIGTHAILEDNVAFADLGVVVIDEQHRFGVEHRAALANKRPDGASPDVLVMTATPIPRSLALTIYGDLDVTVLRNRPGADTITVRTEVIASHSDRRDKLYGFVRSEVDAGRRAYVVCPLIDPSEALEKVTSAVEMHEELAEGPFKGYEVGLMHGRMSAEDRDAVMKAFRDGTVPILVATTVIEVGVSVDEASVMIIEDADRFGISQLHQLRGRLYRGYPTNFCVLFAEDPTDNPRLEALAASDDGFELAEEDLKLRREGKLFDTAQTGEGDLRIASVVSDVDVVARTRDDARALLEEDPDLDRHPDLLAVVAQRWNAADFGVLEGG